MYLYVRMLTSEKKQIHKTELFHLIPFAVMYLVSINMSHSKLMLPLPDRSNTDGLMTEGVIISLFKPLFLNFGLINGIIFLIYSIGTIVVLKKHKRNIVGVFSQNDNQINLKWIYALPALFALLVIANVINENVLSPSSRIHGQTMHMISFLSFIILLCFFGIKQKPVFHFRQTFPKPEDAIAPELEKDTKQEENEEPQQTIIDSNTTETKHADISEEAVKQIIEDMQNYMQKEKPYTDPDFSVYTLAEAIKLPRRLLSQVLNSGLSKNFYQYVNEFRIEEVKKQLENPNKQQSTVLDIAFQSGFKSKSSFNSLFKQHCNVTPTQYRKMIR